MISIITVVKKKRFVVSLLVSDESGVEHKIKQNGEASGLVVATILRWDIFPWPQYIYQARRQQNSSFIACKLKFSTLHSSKTDPRDNLACCPSFMQGFFAWENQAGT